jgi:5-methylcytosine-specific restriction endonuclease McrBC regulatory subunit McrC
MSLQKIEVTCYDFSQITEQQIKCNIEECSANHLETVIKAANKIDKYIKSDNESNSKIIVNFSNANGERYKNDKQDFIGDYGAGKNRDNIQGYVGVVKTTVKENDNDYEVIFKIHSRFDKNEQAGDGGNDDKPYFLLAMLENSERLNSSGIADSSYDDLFGILYVLRFVTLLKECSQIGFYRKYVNFQRNESNIKGSIDFIRHIKQNLTQNVKHKIAYNTREYTLDNEVNALILAAYEKLMLRFPDLLGKRVTKDYDLQKIIDTLMQETPSRFTKYKDNRKVIKDNLKSISHPLMQVYEQMREFCLRILRDEGMNLFDSSTSHETEGILYYIPDLWEEFLFNKLFTDGKIGELSVKQQVSKHSNVIFENNEKHSLETHRPDFVVYDDKPVAILDAKFWDRNKENDDDSPKEYFDAKVVSDMKLFNAKTCGLIYPIQEEDIDDNPKQVRKFKLEQEQEVEEQEFPYTWINTEILIPVQNTNSYDDWKLSLIQKITETKTELSEQLANQLKNSF